MNLRTSLDAIIILGNSSEKVAQRRVDAAIQATSEKGNYSTSVYVASGGHTEAEPMEYKHQAHMIYTSLRKAGVKPLKIAIESKSQDSLDNLLHSLQKIKGTNIGIVSYPSHLNRMKYIIKKAQEQGAINHNLHFHYIPTNQTLAESLYEIPATALTRYKLRKPLKGNAQLAKKNSLLRKIERWIKGQ